MSEIQNNSSDNQISEIFIDKKSLMRGDANKRDRERAITDIVKENNFRIAEREGPFIVNIEIANNKMLMATKSNCGNDNLLMLPLSPLRRIIKDYHIICESYFEAVNNSDPKKVEAIDMGRRGVHNEGAEIVNELLEDQVKICFETARKLFSLLYILQIK